MGNTNTELEQLMSDVDNIDQGNFDDDEETTQVNDQEEQTVQQPEQTSEEQEQDVDEDMQNVINNKQKETKKQPKSAKVDTNQQQIQPNQHPQGQDLVDVEGKVIAKAGAERRFYEEAQRLRRSQQHFTQNVLPQIKEQYNAMEQELNAYKQVVDGFKASDLSPQDIQSGFDFVRQWKKNPTEVVKFLLTNLQSSGINVDIEGMQPSINAEAIKQMLDAKLAPFVAEREARVQAQEQEQQVTNEYNSFVQKYPDSVVHDKTLAFMVRNDPSLTPELAYYKLKNFYLQKGLDFSVPLEVLAQQKPNETVPQGLPKAPTISENVVKTTRQPHVAGVNEGFKNIIREAMEESGLK